jgi:hypothetical protein
VVIPVLDARKDPMTDTLEQIALRAGEHRVMPLSERRLLLGSICRDRSARLNRMAWRPRGGPVVTTRRDPMADALEQISGLLHEAGETHHRVYRIVDGADDDWASWYAQWLIDLSELPDLLGARPVRSELVYLLVSLDKQYTAEAPGEPWETYYARQILRHFRPSGS